MAASSTRRLLDVLKRLPDLVTGAEIEEKQLAALREELSQKDKMYREESKRFETFTESHRENQRQKNEDKKLIEQLRIKKNSLEKALCEKERELEETKLRLSKIMGMKIMDNNPEIADLSDPNRPTKLGEKYGELYDNEWTDAYETLSDRFSKDEEKVVTRLRDIFKYVFQYCSKLSREQEENLKRAMLVPPSKMDEALPDFVMKQFKDNRKIGSKYFIESHLEIFLREYRNCQLYERDIDSFVKESFELAWLMNIQDPPIEIDMKTSRHDTFDSNAYKAYTVCGTNVDFVVWPTARLHKGGPILYKGVAQCFSRPASSREYSRTRKNDNKSQERPSTASGGTRTPLARSGGNNTTVKASVTHNTATTTVTMSSSSSNSPTSTSHTRTGDTYAIKKTSATEDFDDLLSSLMSTATMSDDVSKPARNKNQSQAGIHRPQPKEAWVDVASGKEIHESAEPTNTGTPGSNYDQYSYASGTNSTLYGAQSMRAGNTGYQQNMAGSLSPQTASGSAMTTSASPSYTQTYRNPIGDQNNAGGLYPNLVSNEASKTNPQHQNVTNEDISYFNHLMRMYGYHLTKQYMGDSKFYAVYSYLYPQQPTYRYT